MQNTSKPEITQHKGNMPNNRTTKYLSIVALSSILVACGSGGSKSSTPPPSAISSAASSASSAPASSSSSAASSTAAVTALIKLNQIGYKPSAEKLAVIPAVAATTFTVTKTSDNSVVLTGNLSAAQTWAPAEESVKLADFSSLTAAGDYTLTVAGIEKAASFKIATNAYDALNAGAIKAFYFNRASTALLEAHAGVYKRAAGHLGTKVYIHKSAATAARPEGTIVSAPKGWYDAGDYNLYVVNSGISTYTLLAAYERYANYFKTQNLNIPESADAVPDLLNEAMWNLEWMLAMQDPNDGGVYHKLTSKNFSGMVMPEADTSDRFMVQKATAATLDFAAVMAAASRIYAPYDATYPGISTKMLNAAKSAYQWAKANPAIYYEQPSDIATGGYGDGDVKDEFAWAAAELYITTKDNAYYTDLNPSAVTADIPSWAGVKSLGWISLAHNVDSLTSAADKTLIKNRLDSVAAGIAAKKPSSAYGVPLVNGDFNWGSNSGALNQAMMLLAAYELDNSKADYLKTAQSLLDYVLGRNPTDFSFVTGFGVRTPQHIHHRPSVADGIAGSIPGFLAGGANPGQQDKNGCSVPYPSNLPAKSYLDDSCSYASNEIAINWNAPLVYVSAALQVLTP
jgi:endoglucanase